MISPKQLQLIWEKPMADPDNLNKFVVDDDAIHTCLRDHRDQTVAGYDDRGRRWELFLKKKSDKYCFQKGWKEMINGIFRGGRDNVIQIWGCPDASWKHGVCFAFTFDL